MLTESQLEKLIDSLKGLIDEQKRFDEYIRFFRFSWSLQDNMREIPPEVEKFLAEEQKNYLRYAWMQLEETVNTASYLQSFIDEEGNWLIQEPELNDDEDDYDEDWVGTSTARTRLANLMHKLGHSPEEALDALEEVLFEKKWKAMSTLELFSNYADDFTKEELKARLRFHVYGDESDMAEPSTPKAKLNNT